MNKLLIIGFVIFTFQDSDKFLSKIESYNAASYYKETVYAEHDYKSFYNLNEPQAKLNPDNYDLHLLNAAFFFVINKLRAKHNKPAFVYSASLRDAALIHSHEMVERKFFSHVNNRNRKFDKPQNRIRICGLQPTALAENIDYNFIEENETYISYAEKLVKDLYESPPHRKNMMTNYKYLGAAVVLEKSDNKGYRYGKATQDFATY
ncbi:MAG: CAP domain-containing protein [Chitinophagales bacterium]|nr:CAP domain-containing protein [Chitinophagales bacterium]